MPIKCLYDDWSAGLRVVDSRFQDALVKENGERLFFGLSFWLLLLRGDTPSLRQLGPYVHWQHALEP